MGGVEHRFLDAALGGSQRAEVWGGTSSKFEMSYEQLREIHVSILTNPYNSFEDIGRN